MKHSTARQLVSRSAGGGEINRSTKTRQRQGDRDPGRNLKFGCLGVWKRSRVHQPVAAQARRLETGISVASGFEGERLSGPVTVS